MKKNIVLLVLLFVLGIGAIIFPSILRKKQPINDERVEKIELTEERHHSTSSTLYDKQQMFFEDIEPLYDYFTFNQVEQIKQKIQKYIQSQDSSILDCKLIKNSIANADNTITFKITYDESVITVEVSKKDNSVIIK